MNIILFLLSGIYSALPIYIFKDDKKKFGLIDLEGSFLMVNLKDNKKYKKQFKFYEGGDYLLNYNKQKICYDAKKNTLTYCPLKNLKKSQVHRSRITIMPSVRGLRISFGDRILKAVEIIDKKSIPLIGRVFSISGIRKGDVDNDDTSVIFNKEEANLPGDNDSRSSSSDSESDSSPEIKAKKFSTKLEKKTNDLQKKRTRRQKFISDFNKSRVFNEPLTHRTLPMRIKAQS